MKGDIKGFNCDVKALREKIRNQPRSKVDVTLGVLWMLAFVYWLVSFVGTAIQIGS